MSYFSSDGLSESKLVLKKVEQLLTEKPVKWLLTKRKNPAEWSVASKQNTNISISISISTT
jgi:hypothetical protein